MGSLQMHKVILIGLVVAVVCLILINRFVVSWTGLLESGVGLCRYKSIGVPTLNGHHKKLSQSYDIARIASALAPSRDYEVRYQPDANRVIVSRIFNGVKYNIQLENPGGGSEFNLNTYNFEGYPNGGVAGGEKCTTPGYRIEKKIYGMIDDLPLNPSQKAELKESVRIVSVTDLKLMW